MNRTIERTLAWCNRVRVAAGLEPLKKMPKGTPSARSCPIARALNFDASVRGDGKVRTNDRDLQNALARTRAHYSGSVDAYEGPQYLAEFVHRFDNGNYPELIKK